MTVYLIAEITCIIAEIACGHVGRAFHMLRRDAFREKADVAAAATAVLRIAFKAAREEAAREKAEAAERLAMVVADLVAAETHVTAASERLAELQAELDTARWETVMGGASAAKAVEAVKEEAAREKAELQVAAGIAVSTAMQASS